MKVNCLRNPFERGAIRSLIGAGLILVAAQGVSGQAQWQSGPGFRSAETRWQDSMRSGFTLLGPELTGILFTNAIAEERHLTNQILLNGSGVAAGDVDGDGWCDLYFCGLDGPNALYRNLGNWKFQNVTRESAVGMDREDASGAVFADIDGDGDLDLLVSTLGTGTALFFNDGNGRFIERGPRTNIGQAGSSLGLGDVDGDGDLDLYVATYRLTTIRDQPNTRFSIRTLDGEPRVVSVDGRPVSDPALADRFVFHITAAGGRGNFTYDENGEPDLFLRNDGKGRFTPVAWDEGMFLDEDGKPLAKASFDWGLSVLIRDLNGDLAPDIYVCNDFKSPDRIWFNDGKGRFKAAAPSAFRQLCLSSMGIDVADVNRDGFDDLFVVDMLSRDHRFRMSQRIDIKPEILPVGAIDNRPQYPRNMLYLNRGDGTWAECAQLSGLEASEWSWTPAFLDVDLDGFEDLLISNGFERDSMNVDVLRELELKKKEKTLSSVEQLRLRKMFPRLATANLAYRNRGDLRFEEVSAQWGFNLSGISHGLCLADLDNDGDQDVILNNQNAPAALYRNEASAPRVAVRLKGQSPNTRGIGARIQVTGGPVVQSQSIACGARYLSSDDFSRTFAASTNRDLTIEVLWRSGKRSTVTGAKANRIYEVNEEYATAAGPVISERKPPLFTDVSRLLDHIHHEEPFDDFARQPTLPHRLSQHGPGVAWFDLDGDGWDDLIVGAGRGGALGLFRNDQGGGFSKWTNSLSEKMALQDHAGLLGWRTGKEVTLLVGSSNYEEGPTNASAVQQLSLASGTSVDLLTGQLSSTGPLAMADVDGDGALDLFVGGRVVPGRYPAGGSSVLFRGGEGRLKIDRTNSLVFEGVGLVAGAVFTDIDGDGDADLALALDWGSPRVFRNDSGRLQDVTSELGLAGFTGWWNGITAGDFDGDGRMDLALSNWGLNTRYQSFRAGGLRAFHGEASSDGVHHFVEGYSERGTGRLLPLQPFHVMGVAMPAMRERVGTFSRYASVTLPEIYGESWKQMKELQVAHLDSTVFLNRGNRFEAVTLPMEAQMAPAFGISAGDLDGDGFEDLFLSQNFFAVAPDTSRYDAGRSLLLRGNGRGGFSAVPGQESGLIVYGEQRGAALSDYDSDGRTDVVVTQNGAATRLFKNMRGRPGLRIRLDGLPGNPFGVGARLRLIQGGKTGPVREIHAGSGYWSQDSAVQVLCQSEAPEKLWISWPGGKSAVYDVPSGAREMVVNPERVVHSK